MRRAPLAIASGGSGTDSREAVGGGAAASTGKAMHGQRALLLPKLCGSESDAEICGNLLPRGEFTGWQL
jgi:hypothetical protein